METYAGAIELFPYNFAPQDWLLCNGVLLSVTQYQLLFASIGIKYGGDGKNTFGLPNFQGFEPIPGMQYYIAAYGDYPQRN